MLSPFKLLLVRKKVSRLSFFKKRLKTLSIL